MNQFLGSLALLPIEKFLNAIIVRDAHVAKQLSAFDSKCIELISLQPSFTLSIRFEDDTVKLSAIDSESLAIEPDATVRGKAQSLLRLLIKQPDQRALADTELDIAGDAILVQDLHVMIQSLDVNWQDYLAPILGDVLSHEFGEVENSVKGWSKSAGNSLHRGIRDYLSEEARVVPSELELDSFSNRLDQLRLRLDRLGAKTEQLQRRASLLADSK